jgi:hypothetical protein
MSAKFRSIGIIGLTLAGVFAFTACDDGRLADAVRVIPESSRASRSATSDGDDVAVALARALAQPGLRARLLQEFRASPWVEHKLVLQEFITTPTGKKLVEAGAEAVGSNVSELTAKINSLPSLDFYVVGDANRRTWTGGAQVAVALTLDMSRQPTTAYTTTGSVAYHDARPGTGSGLVMLLLHPAEPKGRRMKPQAAVNGNVIQDADDGDIGVQYIRRLGNGDSVVVDLRQDKTGKWVTWPRDGSAGTDVTVMSVPRDTSPWTPPPTYPTTYVSWIVVRSVCDFDCNTGNEFEFRATERSITGIAQLGGTARITGINSGEGSYTTWTGPAVPMIGTSVNGDGRTIDVDVVETDGFPNPDDNFDPNPVLHSISDKGKFFDIGDPRTPGVNCPSGYTGQCRELTVAFTW